MNLYDIAIAKNLSGGGGGGGGGDASIATVTFDVTAQQGYEVGWWCITGIYTPPLGDDNDSKYRMNEFASETSNVFPLIMYKGIVYFGTFEFYDPVHDVGLYLENPVLFGGITYDDDTGRYIVTGDCTISGVVTPVE